jgi:hypothetical protein
MRGLPCTAAMHGRCQALTMPCSTMPCVMMPCSVDATETQCHGCRAVSMPLETKCHRLTDAAQQGGEAGGAGQGGSGRGHPGEEGRCEQRWTFSPSGTQSTSVTPPVPMCWHLTVLAARSTSRTIAGHVPVSDAVCLSGHCTSTAAPTCGSDTVAFAPAPAECASPVTRVRGVGGMT